MVKKLFVLASVTALAGLVSAVGAAGCSSSDPVPAGGGATDAKTDTKVGKDTGPIPGDETEPEPASCLSKDPIDATKFPYTKALKAVNACTTKELSDLSAFFKTKSDAKEDVKVTEWAAVVSEGCSKCVFSDGTGAEWTPILVDAEKDELDSVNRGGCIELLSGKESCGAAYQRVTECRLEACLKECKTQDEFTTCLQDGQGIFTGPCKTAYDLMETECGANLGAYETGCKGTAWTFEGPIKVQCITGGAKPADAGKDAN
jgi:hypothetical protein